MVRVDSRIRLLLLLSVLLLSLPGCASIFSSGSQYVHIPIPDSTHFSFVDSHAITRNVMLARGNGLLIARIPNSQPLMFVRRVGDRSDTTVVEVDLKYEYVLMNLVWLPWAPLIDVASDVQFELLNDTVTFGGEPPQGDSVSVTIYGVGSDVPNGGYRYGQYGVLIGAHLGIRMPIPEAALGNEYGFGIGYRPLDPLSLLLGVSNAEVGYLGDQIEIDPTVSSYTLDVRFYPFYLDGWGRAEGVYLFGGVGWNVIRDDEVRRREGRGRIPGTGVDDAVPSLEYGAGYSMPGAFLEARWVRGTTPFAIELQGTPVIDVNHHNFILRWGLFLEI